MAIGLETRFTSGGGKLTEGQVDAMLRRKRETLVRRQGQAALRKWREQVRQHANDTGDLGRSLSSMVVPGPQAAEFRLFSTEPQKFRWVRLGTGIHSVDPASPKQLIVPKDPDGRLFWRSRGRQWSPYFTRGQKPTPQIDVTVARDLARPDTEAIRKEGVQEIKAIMRRAM